MPTGPEIDVMNTLHSEYHFKASESDTAIIFIHGIQGSPSQFDYLIDMLGREYSIENLLLPGHGGTMQEFAGSGMAEWQNYVDERVRSLQKEYRNLILVGHSMGCLLSVQTAVSCPQISGLFLIAMPLRIRVRYPYIKNNIKAAFGKKEGDAVIAAARRGNSVTASSPFAYLAGAPRYIELVGKMRSTRGLLAGLQLPIAVVQSDHDEIVSGRTLDYFSKRPNTQILTVNDSGHYFYSRDAQKRISKALAAFIIKCKTGR